MKVYISPSFLAQYEVVSYHGVPKCKNDSYVRFLLQLKFDLSRVNESCTINCTTLQ